MRVLVSAFEAFDGLDKNPSEELVKLLEKQSFKFELLTIVLPVSFQNAYSLLESKIQEVKPDFVIATGLAYIRDAISIERIAINYIEARIPDNEGSQPHAEKVVSKGEDGIFSTLPVDQLQAACEAAGIKSFVSNTAGTYICNSLMYELIYHSKEKSYKAGFVHLPPTPDIKDSDSMEIEDILKGFVAMLEVLVDPNVQLKPSNQGQEA